MSGSDRPDLVTRLCCLLGRQHALAGLLDWVAGWLLPPPPGLAAAGPPPAPADAGPPETPGAVYMAAGPGTSEGLLRKSPTQPQSEHEPDIPSCGFFEDEAACLSKKVAAWKTRVGCIERQYMGMHGRPCKFASGSDLKCPKGTVSGWFWRYDTPVGVIYYVDCCGDAKMPKNAPWCNWTSETNWCQQKGRAASRGITEYVCTLAIPDKLMKTAEVQPGRFEVVGVDP